MSNLKPIKLVDRPTNSTLSDLTNDQLQQLGELALQD